MSTVWQAAILTAVRLEHCDFGVPGGTRTPDLLVRSQAFYPTGLQGRFENRYMQRLFVFDFGISNEIRTHVVGMKTQYPRPLDDGDIENGTFFCSFPIFYKIFGVQPVEQKSVAKERSDLSSTSALLDVLPSSSFPRSWEGLTTCIQNGRRSGVAGSLTPTRERPPSVGLGTVEVNLSY